MGGQVLEYEAKAIRREAIKEGLKEGIEKGKNILLDEMLEAGIIDLDTYQKYKEE